MAWWCGSPSCAKPARVVVTMRAAEITDPAGMAERSKRSSPYAGALCGTQAVLKPPYVSKWSAVPKLVPGNEPET